MNMYACVRTFVLTVSCIGGMAERCHLFVTLAN
jgi:hypothetical protein